MSVEQTASYEVKPTSYYGNPRADYVALLPRDPKASILELGCGDGATGKLAREEGRCGRYVGIELFEPMAARARAVLDEVHVGNVEAMALPLVEGSFDALIMSEVLEHLVDPYSVVARLARLLRPGGLVLASSPNVSHWRNVAELLRGRWTYTDEGMMDRTHLRWFTPASYAAMFEEAGVAVDSLAPIGGRGRKLRLLERTLGKGLAGTTWLQIDLHGHRRA